jgi:hypothetical protein
MKKRILITIDEKDLLLLDKLATEAKKIAPWKKTGYRPTVIEQMLYIIRTSEITPAEFMRNEYILGTSCNRLHEKLDSQQSAQQGVHPTLLPARHKLVSCPQCKLMFGVDLPAPQSG